MKKFGSFDEMITPGIIKVVYYISLVFVVIASLVLFFGAMSEGGGVMAVFFIIPFAAFGLIMVRVYCELIMLGFKIYENLRSINEKLDRQGNVEFDRVNSEDYF